MGDTSRSPDLPEPIRELGKLADNLWWTWHHPARDLFRALDRQGWRESRNNPRKLLARLSPAALAGAAADPDFLALYRAVLDQFTAATAMSDGWFPGAVGRAAAPLAYFSAEYGLHACLPFYAGGLGILAGDHLKECSDLAVPVVGVGLVYTRGYVTQRLRDDGWPDDVDQPLDRAFDPIGPVRDANGQPLVVAVPLFDPPVHVAIWRVAVGRVSLYLLDTDIAENQPWDRAIAQRLYASNPEQRLRQEIVLGIGGMLVLDALGIRPGALHLNEGHSFLALFERLGQLAREGASFERALEQVRATTIFTTHTPVAAGTDVFPFALLEKYLGEHWASADLPRERLLALGADPRDPGAGFNTTVFALRTAGFRNGVSRRHGEVARQMWAHLWPDRPAEQVPIDAITNGVHLASWIEPDHLQPFLDRYLGPAWIADQDEKGIWELVDRIPDERLWHVHQDLKSRLVDEINERARRRWQQGSVSAGNVVALGALLDAEVLTLGFARRFTAYKRPDLLLTDLDRLKRLLADPWRPVQVIFAGKAHPDDVEGKRLIQKVVHLAQDPGCAGRVVFVENYDQELAEYLVHGVDVWLNTPLPPLEASGTSGIKASANGVPACSIRDGWWIEGDDGTNGWAFGDDVTGDRTAADAAALYALLEDKVVPLFYERSDDGVPRGFVAVMKAAMRSVAPRFSTRRMVKEYATRFYAPALGLAATAVGTGAPVKA